MKKLEDDQLFVAIPEGYKQPAATYHLAPYVARLKPSGKSGEVNFTSNADSDRILAIRFLQSALTDKLKRNNKLWQPKSGRPFYSKEPENILE